MKRLTKSQYEDLAVTLGRGLAHAEVESWQKQEIVRPILDLLEKHDTKFNSERFLLQVRLSDQERTARLKTN